MCWAHASLHGKPSRKLLAKTSLVFNSLESSQSLSHTQPLQEIPHKIQGTKDRIKLQSILAQN